MAVCDPQPAAVPARAAPSRRVPIVQGEHAVAGDPDVVITTLLGSCIAVCLHDGVARVGGMNHFLLGEPGPGFSPVSLQHYGIHAMELLINAMMRAGAARGRLKAHVYGGANIVAGLGGIGTANADFARRFLATEGIAVGRVDVGGTRARRIEFRAHEGLTRSTAVAELPPPVAAPAPFVPRGASPVDAGELELF